MAPVKYGDVVTVRYRTIVEDGSTVDSLSQEIVEDESTVDSLNQETTCTVKVGEGLVPPGIEQALIGMKPRTFKVIKIPCEEAFGVRHDAPSLEITRGQFAQRGLEPYNGQEVLVYDPDRQVRRMFVTHITRDTVTLDANHPLAGKALTLEVELLEIIESREVEEPGDSGKGVA